MVVGAPFCWLQAMMKCRHCEMAVARAATVPSPVIVKRPLRIWLASARCSAGQSCMSPGASIVMAAQCSLLSALLPLPPSPRHRVPHLPFATHVEARSCDGVIGEIVCRAQISADACHEIGRHLPVASGATRQTRGRPAYAIEILERGAPLMRMIAISKIGILRKMAELQPRGLKRGADGMVVVANEC